MVNNAGRMQLYCTAFLCVFASPCAAAIWPIAEPIKAVDHQNLILVASGQRPRESLSPLQSASKSVEQLEVEVNKAVYTSKKDHAKKKSKAHARA